MPHMHRSKKPREIKNEQSTILIFGGSGVIGGAIAKEFGQREWSVGVHYHHNHSSAEKAVAAIQETRGNAQLYQADVNDSSQIKELFQIFLQDYGALSLLVWAIGMAPSKLLAKTTAEEWKQTLQTNLSGAFHVLRHASPIFEKQQNGAVILIGSLSGEQGTPGQVAYSASKAGLMGLMRTTAKEWGPWNIRVNAIFPGWHSSPLSGPGIDSALTQQNHILNRTPSLQHVVENVYHLASTRDISGQIWNLDSRIR